ncbi:hypothetical protein FMK81_26265 [Klebsiella oxytoca]|uniref:hypothetical protein n=1 Tax=Klebsiella oxytoca TaxID=571 RepID=UPI001A28E3E2|nr:hypothetical protein [Klebsiella oxytoca]MBZ7264982.1 hypothetical protein [Klebsiella oxytoca]MCW9547265.1 hypothetical protein [Klebsiella oxytoca]HAT2828847.1 hypothetical protein [Klebsiella oxytoca]
MAMDSQGNVVIVNRPYLNLCTKKKSSNILVIAEEVKENDIVVCFDFNLKKTVDIESTCLFLRCKYPWPDFEIELVKNKGGDYKYMLLHNHYLSMK